MHSLMNTPVQSCLDKPISEVIVIAGLKEEEGSHVFIGRQG